MPQLEAGFGKTVITPRIGAHLVGYAGRPGPSLGVHDELYARAMVVRSGADRWALCAVDLCYVRESTVNAVRARVTRLTDLPGTHICIAAIHTHSGPDDQDIDSWDRPLSEVIADAIIEANARTAPARIGAGFGALYEHAINRRWLERPVDPALGVIRVDDVRGHPLGMMVNYGCHAVVLGRDNLLISADWPGCAAQQIEGALEHGAICLITQGGSGDVNPLTSQVRSRLQDGQAVRSGLATYHGAPENAGAWHIYDREGGTFEEVADLGQAVAEEALRVAGGIETIGEAKQIWAAQTTVDGARPPTAESPAPPASLALVTERPTAPPNGKGIPLEVMGLGIGGLGILLICQPGEIFSETVVAMRKALQLRGYRFPFVLGYANGWRGYLPPFDAFREGGYEPGWLVTLGIDPHIQEHLWRVIERMVE